MFNEACNFMIAGDYCQLQSSQESSSLSQSSSSSSSIWYFWTTVPTVTAQAFERIDYASKRAPCIPKMDGVLDEVAFGLEISGPFLFHGYSEHRP